MKEYKIAKGWAVFLYITLLLLAGLFLFLLIMPLIPGMEDDYPPSYYWIFSIVSLAMISLSVLGILDTIKARFVIESNRIYTEGALSRKELLLHEIKGYRINDKFIFIEHRDKNKKKIKINSYFEKTDEIKLWLTTHYKDLDKVEVRNQKKEILNNPEFGYTKQEREERLNAAQKAASIINWIGGGIGVWAFFFPTPYQYAMLAAMVFPILATIVIKYFKGLIRIDSSNSSAYPTAFWAMFAPCMGTLIRALFDYNLYDYANVWLPMFVITILGMAIVLIGSSEFKYGNAKDFFPTFFLGLLIMGYSYGVIVITNCTYDTSEPQIFKSSILDKHISSGKTKTYYLKLTPWGTQTEPDEISVSEEEYDTYQINDSTHVYLMKGKLNIPWYEISK